MNKICVIIAHINHINFETTEVKCVVFHIPESGLLETHGSMSARCLPRSVLGMIFCFNEFHYVQC